METEGLEGSEGAPTKHKLHALLHSALSALRAEFV